MAVDRPSEQPHQNDSGKKRTADAKQPDRLAAWHADEDSATRYQALFESTGDAIMLLDHSGFLDCNQATLELFGCASRDEFVSKHPSELSPPRQPGGIDSLTAANQRIAQAFRDGLARFEWLHCRLDGSEFMADVLLARVNLANGQILQAVVRDISESKKVEQQLRDARESLEQRVATRTSELVAANEELRREIAERQRVEEDLAYERFLLTTLMDNAPDNIFFKDENSRFLRVSRAHAEYLGLKDPADAIGKSDLDFYGTQKAGQYLADERDIMKTGKKIVGKEEEQRWPDGRISWLLTSKLPLYDADGKIAGTFGLSRDITDQKFAEIQCRAAKEAAEAANQAKSDFLAKMSHEIRTPMNAIIGMTELVLDSDLPDEQREYLKMVRESGDSLLGVIDDILDFSKIESGRLELDNSPFEIRESLGDTMRSMAIRAHAKGLELAYDVHDDVPRVVSGDAGRLKQIIFNLIGNAVKFTEQGEVVLRVSVDELRKSSVCLHFDVADTGIGIPVDRQRLIFEAFEQADNSMTRRFGGTGLGLAISSRLVDRMGGSIWVESEEGMGSRFHFTCEFDLPSREDLLRTTTDAITVKDTRILVVDDNATNRTILEKMLANWGVRPTCVAAAGSAVAAMREAFHARDPFVIVLTDAHMPDVDGFTFADRIKNDEELGSTIIMMLTSGRRDGDAHRCRELGIEQYLLKPIKQSELFDSIGAVLGITSAEDEVEGGTLEFSVAPNRQLRVLVAEDSLVNQKLAVGLLEKYGHTAVVAGDGQQAIEAIESAAYDVVLMDVQMPELDGFEATRAIREKEKQTGRHMPIIAMTAHAMKGDRERCLEAGMDAYIAKPVRAADLFNTMESVLSKYEMDE
jgi:two-component system sensor histidine kinase/response regulator